MKDYRGFSKDPVHGKEEELFHSVQQDVKHSTPRATV